MKCPPSLPLFLSIACTRARSLSFSRSHCIRLYVRDRVLLFLSVLAFVRRAHTHTHARVRARIHIHIHTHTHTHTTHTHTHTHTGVSDAGMLPQIHFAAAHVI